MAQDSSTSEPKPEGPPAGRRLESWKEIAAYLHRGVTTVQRWEKSEGLPVHRHVHARLGSIWADRAEIDSWWAGRRTGIEKDEARAAEPQGHRPRWLTASLVAAVVVFAGLYVLVRRPRGATVGGSRIMVAVLPFVERGGATDQAYFGDGLTDETIAELARLRPDLLGVIARTSALQYKGSPKGIRDIARELEVEYVLEGDVRRSATAVQVDARLIRAADQSQLFAQTYERELGDATAIQAEIARRVAKSLALELLPLQEARLAQPTRREPRALFAYLKGLELLNERTGDDIYHAVASFDEAARLEPTYAAAFAARGLAYALLPTYGEFLPREYYPKAKASAQTALELDPTLADGHAILGVVAHEYEWDHVRAERECREALRLNPSSVLAHQIYAELLTHQGRIEEALGQIREAQRLDPHSPIVDALRGWVLYYGRRYDESIEHLRHVVAASPDFIPAHSYLGWAYDRKGMKAEAKAEYDRVRSLSQDNTPPYNWDFGTGGRRLEDLEARAAKGSFSPYELACLYAAAGRKGDSLRWLTAAAETRDPSVVIMKVDPELDPVRDDAGFQALLRRVGLSSRAAS